MRNFLVLFFVFTVAKSEIVEIDDGKIEGTKLKSRLGHDFFGFFAIPYAQPPLGDLRFRDPVPVKKWNGILNGKRPGNVCFQKGPRFGSSEDCLQLNVFTKSFENLTPVIVFIHGGGYEIGSSLDQGPHNMMDRDIVIVTINYRLGPFGFLALDSEEVPGNAGMKDQVLAMKWVQKNIGKFGGDKNKVTIAGYSAGAFSVTAHLASKMSQGLFHRAIPMSGSITTAFPLITNNLETAWKIGKKLQCDEKNLLECLIKAPAEELAFAPVKTFPECECVVWMPVVERNFGQERFFIEDPSETFRSGNFNRVPVMIGRTADEFISSVPGLLWSNSMQFFNKKFNVMAPFCFFYPTSDQLKSDKLSNALRKAFLPNEVIDVRSFNGLNYLFGDGIIGYPIHKLVRLVSNFTNVFYYKFSFISKNGWKYPKEYPYGVNHGDDLNFSFNTGTLINFEDEENFMVERMTEIFEKFAITGDPNLNSFNWPKYDADQEYYMDINRFMVEKNGMFIERYSVWEQALSEKEIEMRADGNLKKTLKKKLSRLLQKLDDILEDTQT